MILMRHGQSLFNQHFSATKRDPGIADPILTEFGHDQAREAGRALRGHGIGRILVSPYTRALQTAGLVQAEAGGQIVVTPLVRERYAFTCDIGSSRSALAAAWPDHDFSAIETEIWWPDRLEPEPSVRRRAAAFRDWMCAEPPDVTTMLVSHWAFLLALTGRSLENGEWMEWEPDQQVGAAAQALWP